jgi:starch synthase
MASHSTSHSTDAPLRILFVTAEAVPYSKTGGLGDVGGSLPRALARRTVDVVAVVPYYRATRQQKHHVHVIAPRIEVPVGNGSIPVRILETSARSPDGHRVLFVDCPELFDRAGIYGELGHEYADNVFRFGVFCGAALELVRKLPLPVDVFHVQDWQGSMLPVMRATRYRDDAVGRIPVVLTIHNLQYQGLARHEVLDHLGLPRTLDNFEYLEFFGRINTLKGGIVFSDFITTVSRRYAREILTADFGGGLEGVLLNRRRDIVGVVNGIDDEDWNPARDRKLVAPYSRENPSGKARCKEELQRVLGLPVNPGRPILGFIGRMAEQKGIDLLESALGSLLERDLQVVFLGTGQPEYERRMDAARRRWPGRVAGVLGYSEDLAHRYAAGLDMLLVPSRFEPCGLVQLYSLRYGTIPVVHRVGGLADTVLAVTPYTLRSGEGTGFPFPYYTVESLLKAVDRALQHYRQPEVWAQLVRNCMAQDWSWDRSAERYVKMFRKVVRERGGRPPRITPLHRGMRVHSTRGPYQEYGPALPAAYGIDTLRLLPQSPFWVFAYFELAEGTRGMLRQRAGGGDEFLTLALDALDHGEVLRRPAGGPVGEHWFPVEPDRQYRVRLLFRGSDGNEVEALRSPVLHTPPAAPSDVIDPEFPPVPIPEGMEVPPGLLGARGEVTGLGIAVRRGRKPAVPGEAAALAGAPAGGGDPGQGEETFEDGALGPAGSLQLRRRRTAGSLRIEGSTLQPGSYYGNQV